MFIYTKKSIWPDILCLYVCVKTAATSFEAILCVSGTGKVAEHWKDAGFKGAIDGIEMNAAMLEIARAKGLYRQRNISNIPSILQQLTIPTSSQEVILSHGFICRSIACTRRNLSRCNGWWCVPRQPLTTRLCSGMITSAIAYWSIRNAIRSDVKISATSAQLIEQGIEKEIKRMQPIHARLIVYVACKKMTS